MTEHEKSAPANNILLLRFMMEQTILSVSVCNFFRKSLYCFLTIIQFNSRFYILTLKKR